jgi:hypothetical protein
MTGILQAAVLAGSVTTTEGLPPESPVDAGPGSPGDGMGWVGLLMLLIVLGSIVVLVVKVLLARRIARDSGMSQGRAAAMTLLSDDGLDATYLAANVRPVPPGRPSARGPSGAGPAAGGPAAGGPAAAGSPPARSTEERLGELQSLLDRGLVTREEYAARRRSILDAI